jgi:hypothetical protein
LIRHPPRLTNSDMMTGISLVRCSGGPERFEPSTSSEIDGKAPCYPLFLEAMSPHKSSKDG